MGNNKFIKDIIYVVDGSVKSVKDKYGLMRDISSRFTSKSKFYNTKFREIQTEVDCLPEKMTLDFVLKLEPRVCRMIIITNNVDIYPEKRVIVYAVQSLASHNRLFNLNVDLSGDRFLQYSTTNMVRSLKKCGTPFITSDFIINAISAIISNIDSNGCNIEYPNANGSVIDILFTHHDDVHEAYPEMQMAVNSHHVLQAHVDYISDVGFQMFLNHPDIIPEINFSTLGVGYMIYASQCMLYDEFFDKVSSYSFGKNKVDETVFSRLPLREQYRMAWRYNLTNPRGLPIYQLLHQSDKASEVVVRVRTGDIQYNHLEEIYLYVIHYEVDPDYLAHINRDYYEKIFTLLPCIPELTIRREYPVSIGPKCFCNLEKAFNESKNHFYCRAGDDNYNKLLRLLAVYGPLTSYNVFLELQKLPENCLKLLCMMKGIPLISASLHDITQCLIALVCGVVLSFDNYMPCYKLYQADKTKITDIVISKLTDGLYWYENKILDANLDMICKYHSSVLFQKLYSASYTTLPLILNSMGINHACYYVHQETYAIIEINGFEDILDDILQNFHLYVHLQYKAFDNIKNVKLKYLSDVTLCDNYNFSQYYTRFQIIMILNAIREAKTICFLKGDQKTNTVTWLRNGNCIEFSIADKLVNVIDDYPHVSVIAYKMVDPKGKFETTRQMVHAAQNYDFFDHLKRDNPVIP